MTEGERKRRVWWTLWFPVLLAFLLIIGAWVTVIVIAANNPTERVPAAEEGDPAAEPAKR